MIRGTNAPGISSSVTYTTSGAETDAHVTIATHLERDIHSDRGPEPIGDPHTSTRARPGPFAVFGDSADGVDVVARMPERRRGCGHVRGAGDEPGRRWFGDHARRRPRRRPVDGPGGEAMLDG